MRKTTTIHQNFEKNVYYNDTYINNKTKSKASMCFQCTTFARVVVPEWLILQGRNNANTF